MPARSIQALIVIAVASVAATALSAALDPFSETAGHLSAGLLVASQAVAVAACLRAARHTRARARLVWMLFAGAQALLALTNLAYLALTLAGASVPEVSLFDAAWLAAYVPMLLAILLLYGRLRPERGWQGVIDGVVIALALSLFAWRLLLSPAAASGSGGIAGAAVNLLYPALDLVGALALAWVVVRQGRAAPAWLWLLLGGSLFEMFGDVSYLLASLHGLEATAMSDIGYAAGAWMLTLAATMRCASPRRVWAPSLRSAPPVWASALPFLFGSAMFALLIPENLLVGSVAMVGMVLVCWRVIGNLCVHDALIRERDQLLLADPLTGALNRRSFEQEMERAVARASREGDGFALIAFDLDRFKEVNDRLGHLTGDQLLVAVVAQAQAVLRRDERLFRLGGDEFAVIADGSGQETSLRIAERLRDAVRDAAYQVAPGIGVSVSVGVAHCPGDGMLMNDLMRSADAAMYAAKRSGRDGIVLAPGRESR